MNDFTPILAAVIIGACMPSGSSSAIRELASAVREVAKAIRETNTNRKP